MSGVHEGLQSRKRIDQNSEQGKALQQVVQVKLKDFLGPEYADDVLPLYIVVMLAHGNQADLVADNLEAFLGQAHAELFVQWYFNLPHNVSLLDSLLGSTSSVLLVHAQVVPTSC